MNLKYKHVMSPVKVGRHWLKNRIIAAPVTLHSASNGENYPTEDAMHFFVQRAQAGAGLVVCAGVKLLPATDDGEHASWDVYKHNSMNRLAELAERIHFYGAKASMELIGIFDDGYTASDSGLLMDGITPGREIPISEMMRYKEAYAHSAEALMTLGYDGILLHFGHSIPIAQFLSPLTNQRRDEYGGSFENRIRYIVEILEAIRERVGDNLIIEIRMSANEFKAGSIDTEEGIRIAEVLQQYADILQASCGMVTPELMCRTHPSDFLAPNPNVHLAEAFKKSGKISAFVTAIGGIGNLEDADEIIRSGKSDFVAMSRSLIADPELIPKTLEGNAEDVVPCIKCMRCHDSTVFGHYFQCSVNPVIGMQRHLNAMIQPVKKVKKVAVVGGGPAGMTAALTAAKRGHAVTLYEMTDSLGGTLKFADKVSFKYSLAAFKNYLIRQVEESSIDVQLESLCSPELLKKENFDEVITAVGAKAIIPPISGVEHAVLATNTYGSEQELGETVIVVGGGQVGSETALHLARLWKKVTVLEMKQELASDASLTHRGDIMAEIAKEANFTEITDARCTKILPKGVVYEKEGKEIILPADKVILAAGMQARDGETDCLAEISPRIWIIGDCKQARTVETAVREGYFAGINL